MWVTFASAVAFACSCSRQQSFQELLPTAGAVVIGHVVESTPEGMLVLEVVSGVDAPATGARIRVWGDSGKSCRPSIARYRRGDALAILVEPLEEGESHPGVQPGDWGLPRCSLPSTAAPASPEERAAAELRWRKARDQETVDRASELAERPLVLVEGQRQNGKAGPMLVLDGVPVYVHEAEPWPVADLGHPVRLRGALSIESRLPVDADPDGEIAQGTPQDVWVLRVR